MLINWGNARARNTRFHLILRAPRANDFTVSTDVRAIAPDAGLATIVVVTFSRCTKWPVLGCFLTPVAVSTLAPPSETLLWFVRLGGQLRSNVCQCVKHVFIVVSRFCHDSTPPVPIRVLPSKLVLWPGVRIIIQPAGIARHITLWASVFIKPTPTTHLDIIIETLTIETICMFWSETIVTPRSCTHIGPNRASVPTLGSVEAKPDRFVSHVVVHDRTVTNVLRLTGVRDQQFRPGVDVAVARVGWNIPRWESCNGFWVSTPRRVIVVQNNGHVRERERREVWKESWWVKEWRWERELVSEGEKFKKRVNEERIGVERRRIEEGC